jgi:hypothetical protein
MPIQDGSPKYAKQYKTTLSGATRKAVEFYMTDNDLREGEALRELIIKGLMAINSQKNHPFFANKTTAPKQQ